MARPETEVLVHISAPSKASDDVKYHCLAQAYLAFEPARRLDIVTTPHTKSSNGGCRQPDCEPSAVQSFDFPSLSFKSVWENVSSPDPVQVIGPRQSFGLQSQSRPISPNWGPKPRPYQTFYVSPTVVIPDSQPDAAKKPPTARLSLDASFGSLHDTFISDSEGGVASGNDITQAGEQSPDLSMSRKEPFEQKASLSQSLSRRPAFARHDAIPSSGWEGIPSSGVVDLCSALELPSSPTDNIPSSLPDECGQVILQKHYHGVEEATTSVTKALMPGLLMRGGALDLPGTKRRWSPEDMGSSPPPIPRGASDAGLGPKRPRIESPATASSPPAAVAAVGSSNDASAQESMQLMLQMPSSAPSTGPYLTTLRILSPDPPVSCAHLDVASLITEKLARLARALNMARRYRPSASLAHILRPFERGCWHLDTSSWPVALRHQAWEFLAQYVGLGDAGWSVWCSRGEEPHAWLRLHCFAATAGHTYLLLYLASRRHILGTGAAWLGASGTPAITVSPKRLHDTALEIEHEAFLRVHD